MLDYLIMQQRSNGGWYECNYLLDPDLPPDLCLDWYECGDGRSLCENFSPLTRPGQKLLPMGSNLPIHLLVARYDQLTEQY